MDLKRKRDTARFEFKRGKAEYERNERTKLSKLYCTGFLEKEQEKAETAYGDRKLESLSNYLRPRLGE